MADTEDDVVIDDTEVQTPAAATGTVKVDVQEGAKDDDVATLPEDAIVNPDGSVTLPLLFPRSVTIRSATGAVREDKFDRLTFHRLTGADLNAFRNTAEAQQSVVLFTRSTRVRAPIMRALYDRLDAKDVTRGARVLATFL